MPAPSLDFDWELGIFRAVRSMFRWVVPSGPAYDHDRAALLAPQADRLRVLASLCAEREVRVLPARRHGGLRGKDLLLPATLDAAADPEANAGLLMLRAVHGGTWVRLRNGAPVPSDPVGCLRQEVEGALAAVELAREELARFGQAWDEAAAFCLARRGELPKGRWLGWVERARRHVLTGDVPLGSFWSEGASIEVAGEGTPFVLWGPLVPFDPKSLQDGDGEGDPGNPLDGAEVEAPAVEEVRLVEVDWDKADQKTITHTFEKIETVEAFDGHLQKGDGKDELDDQIEALQEIDLRDLVRGGDGAEGLLKSDVMLEVDVPNVHRVALGERGVPYDEWDRASSSYRKDWCTVYPTPMGAGSEAWAQEALRRHRRTIERLYDSLLSLRSGRRATHRQRDGEEVDVDALIDNYGAVSAGRSGSDRLYIRRIPRRRDVATTVLLDISLSSDGWVDNQRVLDVSREAVLVLGEVAHRLGDRFEVLAFASNTRNCCRVFEVAPIDGDWRAHRGRLGMLEPQGYTRMGAPIRHAIKRLVDAQAEHSVLLLITDGQPTDTDRYEGRHGVADVRMALREATREGVVTHALAVDKVGKRHLPGMFGAKGWDVMRRPDDLIDVMGRVYAQATWG